MTGRERRLLRMLCMTASSGGGGGGDDGGDKPFDQLTWDQVIASTKTGKYKSFAVGDMKELDLGTEGIVHMQIVGIDVDELADGSGYAPLTFISKELLTTKHRMNLILSPSSAPYNEGTGAIGGWEKCEMRTYLKEAVMPLIPEKVRNAIKNVTKYSQIYNTSGSAVNNVVSVENVWIPSRREVYGGPETSGPIYNAGYSGDESRKKTNNGVAAGWWLRTARATDKFGFVTSGGSMYDFGAPNAASVALGFCL